MLLAVYSLVIKLEFITNTRFKSIFKFLFQESLTFSNNQYCMQFNILTLIVDMLYLIPHLYCEQDSSNPAMFETLTKAREAYTLYRNHANTKKDIESAMITQDRLKLLSAVSAAENLDMTISIMPKAKELLRDLEGKHRAARAASSLPDETEPYDAQEEARYYFILLFN